MTGPAGSSFSETATLVSVSPSVDGSPLVATYRVNAPDVVWSAAYAGSYAITMQDGEVSDTSGNCVAAGLLGAFDVSVQQTPTTVGIGAPVLVAFDDPTAAAGTTFLGREHQPRPDGDRAQYQRTSEDAGPHGQRRRLDRHERRDGFPVARRLCPEQHPAHHGTWSTRGFLQRPDLSPHHPGLHGSGRRSVGHRQRRQRPQRRTRAGPGRRVQRRSAVHVLRPAGLGQ